MTVAFIGERCHLFINSGTPLALQGKDDDLFVVRRSGVL
tara:strand:+ start:900 stop:1016 length:117 start_codon:yes stop_codon:yes gene_type:complete